MLVLKSILPPKGVIEIVGSDQVSIQGLTFDSRTVLPHWLFFAVRGTQADGHQFIAKAVDAGASVVVCEELPAERGKDVTYVRVECSSWAMGHMASAFYGHPSQKLKLVGITGTNGKTTTVTLLYRMVTQMGGKAGLLSTVTNFVGTEEVPATHTTPDAIELNRLLSLMVENGCSHCFMEVSSHAVVQHRIAGLHFAGALFSNITHDHLDYHKTFDAYIRAKKGFFDALPEGAFAVVNVDDRNGRVMVQNTKADVRTYSLRSMADFRCKVIENHLDGMLLNIDGLEVWSQLIGGFNAYNLLAIYSAARLLGFEQQQVLTALSVMKPVPGRFEHMRAPNGVLAVVDYAHTPDALQNVIDTINDIRTGDQRLITVVGAGGNRDKTKRPVMARVAVQGSAMVVLTSDNPRFEEPEAILDDMKQGIDASCVGKALTIVDRREAIRTACFLAKPGDIVLIAGKGHENYQEVKGVKLHFDDKEIIADVFKSL